VVIRGLQEETGTTIEISDDGTVSIACVSSEGGQAAKKRIEDITADVEVGRVYDGTVLKLLDFGAIVQLLPARTACCTFRRSQTSGSTTCPTISRRPAGQGQGARGGRERARAPEHEGGEGNRRRAALETKIGSRRKKGAKAPFSFGASHFPLCFSRCSSSVLQSMHRVAVAAPPGASSRFRCRISRNNRSLPCRCGRWFRRSS